MFDGLKYAYFRQWNNFLLTFQMDEFTYTPRIPSQYETSMCVFGKRGGGACALGTFSVMLCWSRNIIYLEVKNIVNVCNLHIRTTLH